MHRDVLVFVVSHSSTVDGLADKRLWETKRQSQLESSDALEVEAECTFFVQMSGRMSSLTALIYRSTLCAYPLHSKHGDEPGWLFAPFKRALAMVVEEVRELEVSVLVVAFATEKASASEWESLPLPSMRTPSAPRRAWGTGLRSQELRWQVYLALLILQPITIRPYKMHAGPGPAVVELLLADPRMDPSANDNKALKNAYAMIDVHSRGTNHLKAIKLLEARGIRISMLSQAQPAASSPPLTQCAQPKRDSSVRTPGQMSIHHSLGDMTLASLRHLREEGRQSPKMEVARAHAVLSIRAAEGQNVWRTIVLRMFSRIQWTAAFRNDWWNADASVGTGYASVNTVSVTYDGAAARTMYINGAAVGRCGQRSWGCSAASSNYIGTNTLGDALNGKGQQVWGRRLAPSEKMLVQRRDRALIPHQRNGSAVVWLLLRRWWSSGATVRSTPTNATAARPCAHRPPTKRVGGRLAPSEEIVVQRRGRAFNSHQGEWLAAVWLLRERWGSRGAVARSFPIKETGRRGRLTTSEEIFWNSTALPCWLLRSVARPRRRVAWLQRRVGLAADAAAPDFCNWYDGVRPGLVDAGVRQLQKKRRAIRQRNATAQPTRSAGPVADRETAARANATGGAKVWQLHPTAWPRRLLEASHLGQLYSCARTNMMARFGCAVRLPQWTPAVTAAQITETTRSTQLRSKAAAKHFKQFTFYETAAEEALRCYDAKSLGPAAPDVRAAFQEALSHDCEMQALTFKISQAETDAMHARAAHARLQNQIDLQKIKNEEVARTFSNIERQHRFAMEALKRKLEEDQKKFLAKQTEDMEARLAKEKEAIAWRNYQKDQDQKFAAQRAAETYRKQNRSRNFKTNSSIAVKSTMRNSNDYKRPWKRCRGMGLRMYMKESLVPAEPFCNRGSTKVSPATETAAAFTKPESDDWEQHKTLKPRGPQQQSRMAEPKKGSQNHWVASLWETLLRVVLLLLVQLRQIGPDSPTVAQNFYFIAVPVAQLAVLAMVGRACVRLLLAQAGSTGLTAWLVKAGGLRAIGDVARGGLLGFLAYVGFHDHLRVLVLVFTVVAPKMNQAWPYRAI
ncbi:hypothetical protein BDZ88DRAFT_438862 [Geranomyces variabilis]|nr:hypothetical protein BDZ88DRAFT_438862 [Geranomyces variabilis]